MPGTETSIHTLNLLSLRWFRLRATMVNVRLLSSTASHPFSVFQAIVKRVTSRLVPGPMEAVSRFPVFFHIPGQKHTLAIREGDRIPLEIFFCVNMNTPLLRDVTANSHGGVDEAFAKAWRDSFAVYMSEPEASKNYKLAELGELEERKLADLMLERGAENTEGELALDFLSPFPFTREAGQKRTFISVEQFIHVYEKRLSRLFGDNIGYSPEKDAFSLVTDYWHYTEIRHPSRSQPCGMQFLNGCAGKLYISGTFTNFYPFLLLGSELHAGPRLANSQGYYRLCATHSKAVASSGEISV